jgi:hypothetical protein
VRPRKHAWWLKTLHDEALGVSDLMLKDPAAQRMFARAEKLGVAGEVYRVHQKNSHDGSGSPAGRR